MTIKAITREKCESCSLRASVGCPVVESCHTDAIRLDKGGFPFVAYPGDCDCCFLCQLDCPYGAVTVSAQMDLPFLVTC